MKKILLTILCVAFSVCAFAKENKPNEGQKNAYVAADAIFKKGATLAETVKATRPEYAKWREEQLKSVSADVSFGDWYASQAIRVWHKAGIKIDPSRGNRFDLADVWQNKDLWEKMPIVDGQPFDMMCRNPNYYSNTLTVLRRTVTAKKDCRIYITFGSHYPVTAYLNGKSVYNTLTEEGKKLVDDVTATAVGKQNEVAIFPLDLKKGENQLVFRLFYQEAKAEKSIYFSPYADPSIELARKLKKNFESATALWKWKLSISSQTLPALFSAKDNSEFMAEALKNVVESSMFSAAKFEKEVEALKGKTDEASFIARVKTFEDAYLTRKVERTLGYDVKNVRAAMEDIAKSYPEYDKSLFDELKKWESKWNSLREGVAKNDAKSLEEAKEFSAFAKKALLANPLLKQYPSWVFVRRDLNTRAAGLPANWQGNTSLTMRTWSDLKNVGYQQVHNHKFKDELWGFDIASNNSQKRIFKPVKNTAIADLDISYDGNRVLYSTIDDKAQWHLDEYDVKTGKVKQVSPRLYADIDNYDGCYLPDGKIIYCSSATFVGVPCVAGQDYVPNLFVMNPNAGSLEDIDNSIRQLTYEQDADWMPTVMENGRVMYTRWEYTDNSHYFARILMHMNPDGTAQSSFYGTTSFWPNSLFYCRQVPNDPNKFVGIVSGHHGIARTGELHLFDISKGKIEEQGRVHKFPSYKREYQAKIMDRLVDGKWPQLIHPYPLSEKYIVCAGKESLPDKFVVYGGKFVIYLVDAFDNMVPLVELKDAHAMEPMPLQARKKPQEIMDKTNPDLDYGWVFLNDIYQGGGLKDVPRGSVKKLRVIEYFYGYRNIGNHHVIAEEGSWDIKRIHGTVDVEPDGSAFFKVPANRPIAIQPLDENGNALQLMRSWFVVMPGETQSCVGCHESQGMTPTSKPAMAARKRPQEIKKFVADVRGYSYVRDVQPVLDKYCVGCHDGSKPNRPYFKRGGEVYKTYPKANGFSQSYFDLMRYVRRSGPESNQHMLSPLEFHSSTSELMQLLNKGHQGVKLDKQSMDILRTWIDLNVPFHGVWTEVYNCIPWDDHKRRMWALKKYANRTDDQNAITYDGGIQEFVAPDKAKTHTDKQAPKADGFPFDSATAEKKRDNLKLPKEIVVDMADGISMRFTLIPAGQFAMGSNSNFYDEGPVTLTKIEKPFYMAQFETTNKQYNAFDSKHDSGHLDRHWKDHVNPGYPANRPEQSVIRVSWNDAQKFCQWMSEKFGVKFSLPTEAQWEWAARAGSDKDFWFGDVNANYGMFDNLADYNIVKLAVDGIDPQPIVNPSPYLAYVPNDKNIDDGELLMTEVGKYKPNPFGLYDINGNVAEWTADSYTESLGGAKVGESKAVRGGSWRDRAKWARVTVRRNYEPWQKVYNVGFRVIIEDAEKAAKLFKEASKLPAPKERPTVPRADTI